MSAVQQSTVTIGQHLPWVNMTLDYTDRLVALIPDELLDWRPTDPNGHFFFSLAEIAMHVADTRIMWARQMAGNESEEGYWSIWDETETEPENFWRFHPYGSKQAILDSLARSREELNAWLNLPLEQLNSVPTGNQSNFDKSLEKMREKGVDTADTELRGAATINRTLFAVAAHEAGHRGTLQTLLRINGVDARGDGS
jgi:uncharacterized damage-inducible protein DinB